MQITKPGKYKLTERYSTRGSRSIKQFPAGVVIEITQVDLDGHKVIGPQLEDWEYYEIPCVPPEPPNIKVFPASGLVAFGGTIEEIP